MKNFDELNVLELDTIREIGSIGTGNAATALSSICLLYTSDAADE